MKKIDNKGNLPQHLQLFASQLGGSLTDMRTDFYEMESIRELEINAVDIGYEIIPAVDATTNRGYLVGFDATEPQAVITLEKYVNMSIYFVEATEDEITTWTKTINEHRRLQEEDMFKRRDKQKIADGNFKNIVKGEE